MSRPDLLAAQAASLLATRRRNGTQGSRLPESLRPQNVDEALAIQTGVSAELGEGIGGWKCGLTPDVPVVMAPVHAGTIHTGSPCPARTQAGQVRVEPELAFILGRDLPPRDTPYSAEEIDAAIAHVRLALELIGSRYDDHASAGYLDNLADGLLNQGMLLGPEIKDAELERFTVRVRTQEGDERVLEGRHPNGNPRAPLYWLAEFLRGRGTGLKAGQAVITGSYAGSFDVPAGQDVVVQFGELGCISVRFTTRENA